MEPLIFYEKNFSNGFHGGGSEPNREQLMKSGTISFDGHDDIKSLGFLYESRHDYIYELRVDGEHYYDHSARSVFPETQFDIDFWRSGQSELSYRMTLREHPFDNNFNDEGLCDGAFNFIIELENGEQLSKSLPFLIVQDTTEDKLTWQDQRQDPIMIVAAKGTIPRSVYWDFGGLENVYVPGNQDDPSRYQTGSNSSFDSSNTCWGVTKDAAALLRVYEDALPPESSLNLSEINPSGYGIRNYKTNQSFTLEHEQQDLSSIKILFNDDEYSLSADTNTTIDVAGGQINFRSTTPQPYNGGVYLTTITFDYALDNNISHGDQTGIDAFNQNLTLQVTDSKGNVATKDILVQIVDDAPFVKGEATMDMSSVAAWTLAGDKLPLSYDYLKDVLYRSVDYNDWATGFKVSNCSGKYGSVGVFGDDGNPDDPASAPGAAYYMVDPDKIASVAPDEVVTEAVGYTYTDSDGDTTNGVLNVVLKGTGLNPDEAIRITPRLGNVPTSGGDVPADNPYVPGNPDDPDRDLSSPVAGDYDPMNPNWGLAKDGQPLLRVFESGLPNGSEAGQRNIAAHGYLDIAATAGLKSLVATTDGTDSYGLEGNVISVPLDGGTLTFIQNPDDNSIKYEFALTDPIIHDEGNGINSAEQYVKLIATDNFGNEERIGFEVQIIDDVPRPKDGDFDIIAVNTPVYMWNMDNAEPLKGGISDKFQGADLSGTGVSIAPDIGNYGSFVIYANPFVPDGITRYSFGYIIDEEKTSLLKSEEIVTDPFWYACADADGDIAKISAEIVIHGPGIKPHFTVYEADMASGCELAIPGYEITGEFYHSQHGAVSQDSGGIWRYRLTQAIDSGAAQGSNITNLPDELCLTAKDPNGFELIMEMDVDIIDSVPTFTAGQNSLSYDFGADNGEGSGLSVQVEGVSQALVPGVETMIAGRHGMLTLSVDGSCHYAPNSDAAGIDRFDFTIIDSDGDRALATIEASALDGTPQLAISVQDADSLAGIVAQGVSAEYGGFAGA